MVNKLALVMVTYFGDNQQWLKHHLNMKEFGRQVGICLNIKNVVLFKYTFLFTVNHCARLFLVHLRV